MTRSIKLESPLSFQCKSNPYSILKIQKHNRAVTISQRISLLCVIFGYTVSQMFSSPLKIHVCVCVSINNARYNINYLVRLRVGRKDQSERRNIKSDWVYSPSSIWSLFFWNKYTLFQYLFYTKQSSTKRWKKCRDSLIKRACNEGCFLLLIEFGDGGAAMMFQSFLKLSSFFRVSSFLLIKKL